MLNLAGVDLNLLVVLDALLEEKNVTRASQRVGLSQPAGSSSLTRLRHLFNDELMVRKGQKMVLTPLAKSIKKPLREALDQVRSTITERPTFDPMLAHSSVKIVGNDYLSFLILPKLLKKLSLEAPHVDLVFLNVDDQVRIDALMSENADIGIGIHDDIPLDLRRKYLFTEKAMSLVRNDHPIAGKPLTLEEYIAYPHLEVSVQGQHTSIVDRLLSDNGKSRRTALVIPNFMSIPHIVLKDDVIATLGKRLAENYAKAYDLTTAEPPLDFPEFKFELLWNSRTESDPLLGWIRSLIVEIGCDI